MLRPLCDSPMCRWTLPGPVAAVAVAELLEGAAGESTGGGGVGGMRAGRAGGGADMVGRGGEATVETAGMEVGRGGGATGEIGEAGGSTGAAAGAGGAWTEVSKVR